ncbi:hypothetical protein B1729_07670 [Microbacterium sp. B35-04]|uniref:DUF4397 domain-containing protein n=1 Tax=unclassified Microbacterium TaxID=2609290 RepID=UPI001EF8B9B0|nr:MULTISPECIES: DUF4397 domain-containing protein [unclassified Microbacterium]KAF2413859.1 hypothetical protein B1729_07670 [Microbacterium sp. B35-04]KAF2419465.1 hypothetical protein B2K11_06835 [Microbacterium sp. B35-30]
MRNKILAAIAAGAVAGLGLMVAPASASTADGAVLSVLHGIPETPVDVYVNGELTLDDFQPGDLAGPLDLPAGDYEVALTAPDAADASAPVLGPATLTLAAGTNYTAVAHLNEAGQPTLTPFVNDTSSTAAGEGRLTVRHVAAAPAVDVLAGGTPVVEDLVNPNEASLNLAAGTISASVAAAGTTDPVLGPTDVTVQEGALTIVYAWGSLEEESLAVAVQTVSGLHSAPDGVNSGTGGQLAERDAMMQAMFLVAGLTLATAVAASAVVVVRARANR